MHLTTNIALDWIEGRLARDEEALWKRHMEGCAQCSKDVLHWQQLGTALRRSELESAPEQDLVNAIRIFPPGTTEERTSVRSILAAIVFDSFMQPALAGVRGPAQTARQIVMRAEEFDIHLKIWGHRDHRQMLGQLLRRDGTDFVQSARLHLLQGDHELESAVADETGEFHFGAVPDGKLGLRVELPHLTVLGAFESTGNALN